MKYTKEDYLNRLIKRAKLELRQKAYPNGKNRFEELDDLTFEWVNKCAKEGWVGSYAPSEQKIKIIDKYLDRKSYKNLDRNAIVTLKHEMIHHLVYDTYDIWNENIHACGDSSPIFLGYLLWFLGEEEFLCGHISTEYFLKTDVAKKVKEIKDFESLYKYMFNLWFEYKKIIEESKAMANGSVNLITFGNGNVVGMKKHKQIEYDSFDTLCKKSFYVNIYDIGPMIKPQDIKRLVERKCYDAKYSCHKEYALKDIKNAKLETKQEKIRDYKIKKYNIKNLLNKYSFDKDMKEMVELELEFLEHFREWLPTIDFKSDIDNIYTYEYADCIYDDLTTIEEVIYSDVDVDVLAYTDKLIEEKKEYIEEKRDSIINTKKELKNNGVVVSNLK